MSAFLKNVIEYLVKYFYVNSDCFQRQISIIPILKLGKENDPHQFRLF